MSRVLWSGLTLALLMSSFSAKAALVEGRALCDILDVQVTSVQKQDGVSPVVNFNPTIPASDCLGAYDGNLSPSGLGGNLGYLNQGYLNDPNLFPDYGAFISESDLQDLEFEGNFKDPGWIYVGKQNMGENFAPGTVSKDGQSYTFASDILTMSNCKDKDGDAISCGTEAVSGEWVYKPPQYNPQALLDLLGMTKFFDQVAVVFKAGDQFAIYNFKLADFNLPPVLGTNDANYIFTGTWDMSETLINNGGKAGGLSHFDLWLRDPTVGTTTTNIGVPEPATIAILGLGLLGLRLRRKH